MVIDKMYRENIYEIIEGAGEKISALAVPKNNALKGYAWQVLKETGLDLDKSEEIDKNRLKVGGLAVLLRRGEDIPQIVVDEFNRGRIVLGVTGDDLYDEYRYRNPQNPLKIENTYDWYDEKALFKRPALCLINKSGDVGDLPLEARVAINGKYEYTSRDFIEKSPLFRGKTLRPTVYNGDLESTVKPRGYDCCIDIVYTGRTIADYKLNVAKRIRFSDLVVISPLKTEESLFGRVMQKEYLQIQARKDNPTDSEASVLLKDPEKLRRKIIEEAYELTQALSGNGNVTGEVSDNVYAMFVALVQQGISLDEIAKQIAKRQK